MVDGTERIDTVVIGGGQAGLSVGYHLARRGEMFTILDAGRRIGDSWRNRWDSLRLFTPARYDGLDGMSFPAPPNYFPTKDEMADYLGAYADRFALRVRHDTRVDSVTNGDGHLLVRAGDRRFEAANVVVAMSSWQRPRVPHSAGGLSQDIVQLHSAAYRNPSQLQTGDVLVVGAGNSGAEIALEVSREQRTLLAGSETGHVPFRIEGRLGRLLAPIVLRFLFHHVLTTRTPIGRRLRPKALSRGEPLVRTRPKELAAARVDRVPRVTGARNGMPVLEDGRALDVANIIWCTGFDAGFSRIDLPVLGDRAPDHDGGVVNAVPGLYFVGLKFLYSVSSAQVHGVGRDASRVAEAIAARHDRTTASELHPASPSAT